MNDVVLDSSVVAKLILPEADSKQAERLLVDVPLQGGRLIVLDLAFVEVTNAIWRRYHQRHISLGRARDSLEMLLRSPLTVEPANRLLLSAMEIAIRFDRAVYDALFVALTHEKDLLGITADEPLYRAVHSECRQVVLLRDWPVVHESL